MRGSIGGIRRSAPTIVPGRRSPAAVLLPIRHHCTRFVVALARKMPYHRGYEFWIFLDKGVDYGNQNSFSRQPRHPKAQTAAPAQRPHRSNSHLHRGAAGLHRRLRLGRDAGKGQDHLSQRPHGRRGCGRPHHGRSQNQGGDRRGRGLHRLHVGGAAPRPLHHLRSRAGQGGAGHRGGAAGSAELWPQ